MNFTLLQTRPKLPLQLKLLFLLMFALILVTPLEAYANTGGPSFTNVFPAEAQQLNSGKITIGLTATDSDNINFNSVIMMVDGNLVNPIKQYGWLDEYSDDYSTLDIYYAVNLIEGNHTVQVSVSDMLGATSTKQWIFNVVQPPLIKAVLPQKGSTVGEQQPTISATVTDNTAVDSQSVVMLLNGVKVPATFDSVAGVLSFTPDSSLTNETWHTVTVKAADIFGNQAESHWNFYVNTHSEMEFPLTDSSCQQCHQRSSHPMNQCGSCHGTNTSATKPTYPLDDCYKCHFSSDQYPAKYHNNGLPVADPPVHPAQDTDSCLECHGKTWGAAIPPVHNVTDTANRHATTSQECTLCHSSTLTREHSRRYDSSGQQLTCFSCHNSPDQQVQRAIAEKNSACSACHTNLDATGGHPQHQSGLDSACQSCHSNTILGEQQFHRNRGCNVCHDKSASEVVKYAINTKNADCTACHSQGHNVNLVAKEPVDLPKYPGFAWSVPQNSSLMAGEPWLPDEFAGLGGKILSSSRLDNLSATQLFDWYEQQMQGAGWQKVSGSSEPSNYIELAYQKGDRKATVIIYNGEYHSAEAPELGFKVEILYK